MTSTIRLTPACSEIEVFISMQPAHCADTFGELRKTIVHLKGQNQSFSTSCKRAGLQYGQQISANTNPVRSPGLLSQLLLLQGP